MFIQHLYSGLTMQIDVRLQLQVRKNKYLNTQTSVKSQSLACVQYNTQDSQNTVMLPDDEVLGSIVVFSFQCVLQMLRCFIKGNGKKSDKKRFVIVAVIMALWAIITMKIKRIYANFYCFKMYFLLYSVHHWCCLVAAQYTTLQMILMDNYGFCCVPKITTGYNDDIF